MFYVAILGLFFRYEAHCIQFNSYELFIAPHVGHFHCDFSLANI